MSVLLTMSTCRIPFLFNNLDPDPLFLWRFEELSTFLTAISDLITASEFALKNEGKRGVNRKNNVSINVCLRIV